MEEESIIAILSFGLLEAVPFLQENISGHIHRFSGCPNVLYILDRIIEKYTEL